MAITSEPLCRRYSLSDIQLATKDFDEERVIGHGGFGKVYYGHIDEERGSSTSVAIKRLDSMSNQGAPEFTTEVEMLSKLRHAHLVSLLGCCDDGEEMILVCEYMPNGTLYHHLHNSNTPLSWMQRLRIGIGAARGLDHLHTGVGTQHGIIHRDVKSSNILLDEDWAAKISDFGLAKLCQTNQTSTYVHTGIKGTFGYLDPEIFMTGKFTRKTDVFAFGVVLFELLSGKHAILPEEDDDLSLARWAQNCVKERNMDQIVRDEIRETVSPKSLKEFAQIAYCCLHSDPKERPTMSEVVVTLLLSLALQEKFENYAKPAGLIGFTWKMLSYIFLPKKGNPGTNSVIVTRRCTNVHHSYLCDGDQNSSKDSKNKNDRHSVPREDGSGNNEMLPAHHFKVFSYDELKYATKNFQNRLLISDQRGWVYKGWVNKKTYSPSKVGSRLTVMVTPFHHRPEVNKLARYLLFCHYISYRHGNIHLVSEALWKVMNIAHLHSKQMKYQRVNCHFRPCGLFTFAISGQFSKMHQFPP
ncbi:putative protein kinase RLK-Pelle-CrRLK1L-1 family [Helianthus debilis subsp. tardiflorus]